MLHQFPLVIGLSPGVAETLAGKVEGIVFTVVAINLLLQGLSLPWVCRSLGLSGDALPGPAPAAPLP
jgi:NhaP-type Na+/H+ and K+/H+ antiporter